jgi:hypothetical protein
MKKHPFFSINCVFAGKLIDGFAKKIVFKIKLMYKYVVLIVHINTIKTIK